MLCTPVVPFCPFYFGVSLLKLNSRKKGTLIINEFPGNLGWHWQSGLGAEELLVLGFRGLGVYGFRGLGGLGV